MKAELFKEVSEVFLAIRSMDAEARARVLSERCGQREDLRREVERLLAEDGHRGDELDDDQVHAGLDLEAVRGLFTAAGSPSPDAWRWEQVLPKTVGQYRIIRRIGEGGMGIVCEAEQDNPRRLVAIKLLRSGLGSRVVTRRFAYEAQILARLHHPGIARIYEAGTAETAAGPQPYFAMELITGKPLFEHTVGMTIAERLKLFLLICEAVEYAHTRRVIHRDLKPANIIVDEHGHPRILDFGVALVTDADLQVTTMHTDPGQLVGTLPYMSPEQVSGQANAVDTRTDVYALGIILFQLLSGRLPYDTHSKSFAEAARIIRDQEPTRLGSVDTAFRGDLDTIMSLALEKDAARRYQSVAALAADIQRHLRHEPIEARPASRLYQIGKFARRHPEFILGSSLAVLCLVAGIFGTSWGLFRAMRQRDSADREARKAREAQGAAEHSATRATQLAASLRQVLAAAQPRGGGVANESMILMLTKCADEIQGALATQPEVEWDVRVEIGKSLRSLGAYREALETFLLAHAIAVRQFGEEDARTIDTARYVALAYADCQAAYLINEPEFDAGEAFALEAHGSARRVLGKHHPTTLSILDCVASFQTYGWRYRTAMETDRTLAAALRSLSPEDRPVPLSAVLGRLSCNLAWSRHDEEAAACADEGLSLLPTELASWTPRESRQVTHLWLPQVEYFLGMGRVAEATQLLRTHLDRTDATYGHHHAVTSAWRVRLVEILHDSGDTAGAIPLLRQHISAKQRNLPRDDDLLAWDYARLAKVLATHGQSEEAATTFWNAIDLARHSKKRPLGWYAQELWRDYQIGLGLATYRRWSNESLRLESRIMMEAELRSHPTTFDRTSPAWSDLSYRLVKHGDSAGATSGGFQELLTHAELEPGLYRLDLSVPFAGKEVRGGEWMLVAPWRIQRYAHHCKDITNSERWRARLQTPPDDTVESSTLTALGWWERGLGPFGMHYSIGLVADTAIELPPGRYRITLIANDGGTLDIDGRRVISAWTDEGVYSEFRASPPSSRTWTADVTLTPGPHAFHVEYVQWGGASKLQLRIEPMPVDAESAGPMPDPTPGSP